MKEKISKLFNVYKKYGFKGFIKKLYAYIRANYIDKISFKVMFNRKKYVKIIKEILCEDYKYIIIWRSSFGYNVPLFQRPQHIANNLAKQKCLVLYEVTSMTDKVKTLSKHNNNLYLFNFNNIFLNKILFNELKKITKRKFIEIYSTDWKLSVKNIEDYMSDGFELIYEYIDHLSPELAGTKNLPQNIIDKFNYAMNNKDVYVVTTADELRDDVIKRRGNKNLIESSNGVDYKFFQEFEDFKIEEEFTSIINNGKINLCYYGALAKWFDYKLIKKIAKTNKYNIILFGIKYDDSYNTNIKSEKNIYFMGPRDYKVLKYYAKECDILMIPFLINDITKSTSPVKIFEYMALHKPIVTTNMKECTKYKSVYIGKNQEEFILKLEEAYKNKDNKEYIKLLDKEAKDNDWSKKTSDIINGIKGQK